MRSHVSVDAHLRYHVVNINARATHIESVTDGKVDPYVLLQADSVALYLNYEQVEEVITRLLIAKSEYREKYIEEEKGKHMCAKCSEVWYGSSVDTCPYCKSQFVVHLTDTEEEK